MTVRMLTLDDVRVEGRHRHDLGDVTGLSESIRDVGLLQPIVITDDGRLIAGERRLAAVRHLGWHEIQATVASSLESAAELLKAERDENVQRKDFLPSETAALGAALEAIYQPVAKEAQQRSPGRPASGEKVGSPEPTFSQAGRDEDKRTRAQVGEALGISGPTYQRIKDVAADAAAEDLPDERRQAAAEALKKMDEGVGIRTAHGEYRATLTKKAKAKRQKSVAPLAHHLPNQLPGSTPSGQLHELILQWYFQERDISRMLDAGIDLDEFDDDKDALLLGLKHIKSTVARIERRMA